MAEDLEGSQAVSNGEVDQFTADVVALGGQTGSPERLHEQSVQSEGQEPWIVESATDLYCGTGAFSLLAGTPQHEILGVDVAADSIEAMLGGAYEEDRRALMRAKVWRDGHCVFNALALNDVVVNRGATSGMLEVRVAIDGRFVANQRADGVIIATPTGSTAYSLSVGGPLLHPSLPAWVMAPIAPHTLSNRPIVLSDTGEVTIDLVAGRDASANFDMQSLASLLIGDRITVKRSNYHATFLHPRGWSYYDTLRQKLHWNEGVA